ncbi:hypothetical protein IP92_03751 [Pseudoduganella flava]|uniref:Uncharacterized protein n=1 Tax=Pseudoduganella flava TaxID=871742 RepID=A0A562PM24_9BURK|nr:hypothetical protein [Pseudoduganella flava]QGZ40947.1 hypothetical protein GO485_18965 [Pseudoduganella flava]TWI45373.1 hypothetical protein IP92_03751 [Pseudoduganella flava]
MNQPTQLTFINEAADSGDVSVVFYQRNMAGGANDEPLAWHVIGQPARDKPYTFDVPAGLTIHLVDNWNNQTPMHPVAPGDVFEVITDHSGELLRPTSHASLHPAEFEVHNGTPRVTFTAEVRRGDRPLARKPNFAPGAKAHFAFRPTIWVAAVTQATPGAVLPPSPQAPTEFALPGAGSATITMHGGGAAPLTFTMDLSARR